MNKVLIALLTGVAVGLLIAPAKGSETRRRLSKSFNDLTEDLEDEAENLYKKGNNVLNSVASGAVVVTGDIDNLAGSI